METTLEELDFRINQLKQEQNFNECLSLIEKAIGIKSETYGKKSKEVMILLKVDWKLFIFSCLIRVLNK